MKSRVFPVYSEGVFLGGCWDSILVYSLNVLWNLHIESLLSENSEFVFFWGEVPK